MEALIQAAREEEDRAMCEVRKARSDSFHQWAAAETKGSLKQICRWVRDACRVSTACSPRIMAVCWLVKPALLELLTKLGGLFGNQALTEGRGPPAASISEGGEVPALTAGMLRAACREIGLDKAPGEDGWTAVCMDAWSSIAWDWVCASFCGCGKDRAVARQFGRRLGVLAPEGRCRTVRGTDPLQARPIVLLAVLYRVWAKTRSRYLEQWIKEAGMQPLEESGAACEDLAIDLAFVLEAAKATDKEAWAVATDLSKAYDRIP